MEGRVVVSFRAIGGPGRPFLARLRALIERLTPLGAQHVGLDVLKATFAFDAATFPAVLDELVKSGPDTEGQEPRWAIGIAQGDLKAIHEEGSALLASGLFWTGPPLVAATALSGLARPGEILCAQTVPAVRNGELVTSGLRIAREGTLRVRGARVEQRQPWKRLARENLARLTEPALVDRHLPTVHLNPGNLAVVRADPGAGGTRFLRALAEKYTRSLFISPAGSGFEPFGALRRAVARTLGTEVQPLLLELTKAIDALLSGKGVSLDVAAKLITAILWPKPSGTTSCLLVDDARSVDPATLEACVRAVKSSADFGLVVRLDATSGLPSVLAVLPQAPESEIQTLSREASESVAAGLFRRGDGLDDVARRRWARLGGGNPLAIVEAISCAIGSGELIWDGARASPRSRAAGRGKIRPAGKWIRQRANAENIPARALLSLLAVAGGEARVDFIARALDRAGVRIDLPATLAHLEATRWIVRTEQSSSMGIGAIAFPTRTHCKALFTTLEEDARRGLHRSIARVLEDHEGIFGRVEGAWHAAQAGEAERAAPILLAGARATAEAHLEASTTQLIALARRIDPSCEEEALELLANAVARAPSVAPPPATTAPPGSPPPATALPRSAPPATTAPPRSAPPATTAPPVSAPPSAAARPPSFVPETEDSGPPMSRPPLSRPAMSRPPATASAEGPRTVSDPPAVVSAAPKKDDEDALVPTEPLRPALTALRAATDPPGVFGSPTVTPASRISSVGPSAPPESSAPGSQIAVRLGELAKEALLLGDNASLERWVDGLSAAGESPAFTERMRAMARLGRGDIGDALRVLRRTRGKLDPSDQRRRCQTSLALGVALSVAGRPQDALLEGLDALARARQFGDERGAKACLAFLAKLYTSVSRDEDGARLRQAST